MVSEGFTDVLSSEIHEGMRSGAFSITSFPSSYAVMMFDPFLSVIITLLSDTGISSNSLQASEM